jgi:rRNA maturation endonuclease Nob1
MTSKLKDTQLPSSPPSGTRVYAMQCSGCGARYLSGTVCTSCGSQGVATDEILRKTFDAPDLMKKAD